MLSSLSVNPEFGKEDVSEQGKDNSEFTGVAVSTVVDNSLSTVQLHLPCLPLSPDLLSQ